MYVAINNEIPSNLLHKSLGDVIFRFSQSMIHHITMFVVGVLMYVSGRVEFKHKTILRAIPIFFTCVVVAFSLNIVFHQLNNQIYL